MSDYIDRTTETLDDGTERTVTIWPDYHISVLDEGDWFGHLVETGRTNDYGHDQRPSGFDGRARKIRPSQMRGSYWWQPPADVADEHLADLQRNIEELLDWGYVGIGVEVELPDGSSGSASCWGIGAMDDEGQAYHVKDLTDEARYEAEQASAQRWAKACHTSVEHVLAMLAQSAQAI